MFELIMGYGPKVLMYVLALLAGLVTKYVVTLTKNRWAQGVIQRAYKEIEEAVIEVMQTYVAELKKANADGMLTPEEKQHAKELALSVFKENFGGSAALARLARALGLSDVTSWVESKLEGAVTNNKYIAAKPSPLG